MLVSKLTRPGYCQACDLEFRQGAQGGVFPP